MSKKTYYLWLYDVEFSNDTDLLKKYINDLFNGGHFGFYPKNEAFPKEDLGRILCVFLYSPTESNYVEKHLLTFISIKYLSIFHLKMQIIHMFRSNYLTLALFVTSLDLL